MFEFTGTVTFGLDPATAELIKAASIFIILGILSFVQERKEKADRIIGEMAREQSAARPEPASPVTETRPDERADRQDADETPRPSPERKPEPAAV